MFVLELLCRQSDFYAFSSLFIFWVFSFFFSVFLYFWSAWCSNKEWPENAQNVLQFAFFLTSFASKLYRRYKYHCEANLEPDSRLSVVFVRPDVYQNELILIWDKAVTDYLGYLTNTIRNLNLKESKFVSFVCTYQKKYTYIYAVIWRMCNTIFRREPWASR